MKTSLAIRQEILRAGVSTQAELAQRCSVSPRMIGFILHGDKVSRPTLRKISRILGITPSRLRELIQQSANTKAP